jgi:hypothetical protein
MIPGVGATVRGQGTSGDFNTRINARINADVDRKRAIAARLCYKKQNLSIAVTRLIYTG